MIPQVVHTQILQFSPCDLLNGARDIAGGIKVPGFHIGILSGIMLVGSAQSHGNLKVEDRKVSECFDREGKNMRLKISKARTLCGWKL